MCDMVTLAAYCLLSVGQAAPPPAGEPYFGLRLVQRDGGVVEISYVDPPGLGRRIGLQKGDVVTHFQGQRITRTDDLVSAFKDVHPGHKKRMRVTDKVVARSSGDDSGKPVLVEREIEVDGGEYFFRVERREGNRTVTKVFQGKVAMIDRDAYKKIKTASPSAPVKVGSFHVVPKR